MPTWHHWTYDQENREPFSVCTFQPY